MKQKRIARMTALLLLVVLLATMLTSCSKKLSGTYKAKDSTLDVTYTFDDDKVKIEAGGDLSLSIEGTYKIEDGKIYITYSLLGISTELDYSFEKKGSSIFIDGVEYEKQK